MLGGCVLAFAAFLTTAPVVDAWKAPTGCPDEAEMQARLQATGGDEGLRMRGHIVDFGGGLRLELHIGWDGAHHQRVLVAKDCDVLSESAMLLVGVRMDAPKLPAQHRPDPAPEPGRAWVPDPDPRPGRHESSLARVQQHPRPDVPSPSPARPVRPGVGATAAAPLVAGSGFHLRLTSGVGRQVVAPWSVPLRLTLGWSWPRMRLSVRTTYWIPQSPTGPIAASERGGRVQLGTVGPQVCVRPRLGPVEFPQCVHVGIGGGRIDGIGSDTHSERGPWFDVGAATGVVWPVWRGARTTLSLAFEVAAEVPIVSTGYTLDSTPFFMPAAVLISGVGGLELSWGRVLAEGTGRSPRAANQDSHR